MPSHKLDKKVGKVVHLNMPDKTQPVFRWIVKKREDGRFIVRAPKAGVAIKELKLLRPSDYGKDQLLHKDAKEFKVRTTKAKKAVTNKNKTNKNKTNKKK